MKNRLPGFCFFVLYIFSKTALAKVDPWYEACVPETCGDGQNITFPFYIRDKQQAFCGYPGFEVSCNSQGKPILNLDNIDYIIHQIFYQDQFLRLSSVAAVSATNTNASCINLSSHRIQNVSLPQDRFALLSNQTDLVLLYNCSSSLPVEFSKYKEGFCEDYENETAGEVLALVENDPNLENISRRFCNGDRVVAPVDIYGRDGGGFGIGEVINKGFLLNWTASNCNVCEASGGKCGFNLSAYHFRCFCPDGPHAEACSLPGNTKNLFAKVVIAIVSTAIGMMIFLAFCLRRTISSNICLVFWKKKTEDCQKIEAFLRNHESLAPKRYGYSYIKKMTNSFKHKLGQGGYGGVYRGSLLDGRSVAVKVLTESKGNGEEFINEVASISQTSHMNIVTLLGFCFEGHKRALIYEYMSNGSLEKFIFEKNQSKTEHKLRWGVLYKIAVGIARGLEYLHRGCNTRILHFDIKPHNILLDENFHPKISDFGLAKICLEKESIVSMTGVRGTIGYIAPEVFSRNFGVVSHKSDVYSYGMMVLDMTTGRIDNNIGVNNSSEIYFPHWIYQRLEVDEKLGLEDISNEDDKECVKKMIIVSLWCIQNNPSNRPTISRVVEMLEGSLESLQIPPKPFLTSPESPARDSSNSTYIC